ncbi:Asp23/Gls24 family envelope stress response protein [Streptomyces sp. NPDC055055]
MTTPTDPPDDGHADEYGEEPGDGVDRLGCGRSLVDVWDLWERRAHDPHRRSCVHCGGAVADLERLESAVCGLRDETEGVGEETASLARRIMNVVRLELRPGRPLPLGAPDEDLWVMEAVAARAFRAAAETVPGVRAGSCRFLGRVDHAGAEVRLEVHAPADRPLTDLAARVRHAVYEAADRELGMHVTLVHVVVADVVTPSDEKEGRAR